MIANDTGDVLAQLLVVEHPDRVPLSHGRRLAGRFPDARLEWIEDSFAFIPEDQPDRLAALLTEFDGRGAPATAEPSPTAVT